MNLLICNPVLKGYFSGNAGEVKSEEKERHSNAF
jgi:hypothetical protein